MCCRTSRPEFSSQGHRSGGAGWLWVQIPALAPYGASELLEPRQFCFLNRRVLELLSGHSTRPGGLETGTCSLDPGSCWWVLASTLHCLPSFFIRIHHQHHKTGRFPISSWAYGTMMG